MPRRASAMCLWCLMILAGVASAATTLPAVTVALVHDGPGADQQDYIGALREELVQVLATDYRVSLVSGDNLLGDYTLHGVQAALDTAFAAPDVDLVVCTGAIGSVAAIGRNVLRRPTIASFALSSEVQSLPLVGGSSGVKNLTYVLSTTTFVDELAALQSLVPGLRRLAVLGSDGFFEALPGIDPTAEARERSGVVIQAVRAGTTAATALRAIPADAEGVLLPPLIGFSDSEVSQLLEGLKARRLPSVALEGEKMVARGALMGITPAAWSGRVVRRVALDARKILAGEDAADLPVSLVSDDVLFVNVRTARAIGISPPFAVMVDAVTMDVERQTGRRLTLQSVMDEAVLNNNDLAATAAALAAARAELSGARSRLLPQIDLSLSSTMLDEDRATLARRPSERSTTAVASVSQVLWSDDAWAGYDVQKHLVAQQEAVYRQDRLDVALEAATSYFQVLRALTAEDIQRANLGNSRQSLQQARLRVRLGAANRAEVLRWQSKIATEKADVITAIVNRNVAEMELNRTLGRPLEEPIVLAEPDLNVQLSLLLDPKVARYMTNAWDLRQLRQFAVEYAHESSPELAQLSAGMAAQRRLVANSKRAFFVPDVALNVGWSRYLDESGAGADDRSGWALDDTEWSASLGFSLPLFQGGQRFAERNQAGHELVQLRAQHAATAERIEQRVRAAVHRTSASLAAIELYQQAATASRENLELVDDSYSRGAVDLITLLDAQTSSLRADLAAADAVYAFLLDLMETERAGGGFSVFAAEPVRQAWLQNLEQWFDNQER